MKKRIIACLLVVFLLSTATAMAADNSGGDGLAAFAKAELSGVYAAQDGKILATDKWNKILWDLSGETPLRYAGRISVADSSGEPIGRYYDAADRLQAFFLNPAAIAPFLEGYAVADASANVLRYVTEKEVRTLAGSGKEGNADGVGAAVRFSSPSGLAVDDEGSLYIADTGNGSIRLMTKKGNVTTLVSGLTEPTGLSWANGSLYVAETGKNRILKITDGETTVVAGREVAAEDSGVYYGGYKNGPADEAEFDHPQGVAVDSDGTVYVADTLNNAVRMLKNGRVYTVAHSDDLLNPPVLPRDLTIASGKLFVACKGGLLQVTPEAGRFEDVKPADWYAQYAAEAALRGLVRGTTDTTFSPDMLTTRAQFAAMLGRLHTETDGSAVIDGSAVLEDIIPGTWYASSARWAVDNQIILGIDGKFQPSGNLTREQAVVMLWRYAKLTRLNTAVLDDLDMATSFTDSGDISDWAFEAMRWAVGTGILQGADNALLPGVQTNRAQIAAILLRFMDVFGL
ncbi:MAG: S-layer homology domain-containing protein [Clostridia bacterium]|nr:S-layer homology domain-containing protein [Clostridia bacterium]